MFKLKGLQVGPEVDESLIQYMSEIDELSIITNTDVVSSIEDCSIELYNEYPLYIKHLKAYIYADNLVVSEDDNFMILSNSNNIISTLDLNEYYYTLSFKEENNKEDSYYILERMPKVIDLTSEYPKINIEVNKIFDDEYYDGKIYIQISPINEDIKCVYSYSDKDEEMVMIKILEQLKEIKKNIQKYSELFFLTPENIFICKNEKLEVGKLIDNDEYGYTFKSIENNNIFKFAMLQNEHEFRMIVPANYTTICISENNNIIIDSKEETTIVEEIKINIDLFKQYNSNLEKLKYMNATLNLTELEDSEREKTIGEFEELCGYFSEFFNLNSVRDNINPSFILVDTYKNDIVAIHNVVECYNILDNIRSILYVD